MGRAAGRKLSQRSRESVDCRKRELPVLWTGATNGRVRPRKAQLGTVERTTGATAELSKANGRGSKQQAARGEGEGENEELGERRWWVMSDGMGAEEEKSAAGRAETRHRRPDTRDWRPETTDHRPQMTDRRPQTSAGRLLQELSKIVDTCCYRKA